MLNILDLVQLEDLLQPDLIGDKIAFVTDCDDVTLEFIEIDRDVVDSGEYVGKETVWRRDVSFACRISLGTNYSPVQQGNIFRNKLGNNRFRHTLNEDLLLGDIDSPGRSD